MNESHLQPLEPIETIARNFFFQKTYISFEPVILWIKLSSAMLDKWAWFTILSIILVIVVPLALIWLILQIPEIFRIAATIAIFVVWAVVSGYKDWVISKRKEAES